MTRVYTSNPTAPTDALTDAPIQHPPRNQRACSSISRLYPSRCSGRYRILTLLRQHIEYIIASYLQQRNIASLIDLGCGDMPYRPLIEPHVGRYIGVDIAANEQADAMLDGRGRCAIADAQADAVISTQVLEHIDQSCDYLAECHRLLAPGGLLLLSTHGYWKYHPHPGDYHRWTRQGLEKLLEQNGFAIKETKGLLGLSACGAMLMQDGIIVKLPRILRPSFAFIMQLLVGALDRLHSPDDRQNDACVWFIVAEKKAEETPA